MNAAIESLKSQRDLYTSFRDLFHRYERLSVDSVDALRKKVEWRQSKIEGLRAGQKPGFEAEVDKHVAGKWIIDLLQRRHPLTPNQLLSRTTRPLALSLLAVSLSAPACGMSLQLCSTRARRRTRR